MTTVAYAVLPVIPTFNNFSGEFTKAVRAPLVSAGNESGSAAGRAIATGAKTALAGLVVGVSAVFAGAGAIASKGLDRALNIQDAKSQLTGLGHDAASVSTIMESALASVKGTAFGLDESATIAASAVAAGIAPGEALTRTLKLTADSATIAKVPLSEMGSIINKVATNQRLTTETMQQFQDRGIPILQAVANQYGVTSDEAAEMVSRGEVDFATFQAALESSVGGAALSSGSTARGAFANIGAAFGRMGAMFVQPAVDGAPSLFSKIANAIDRASTSLAPFAADLGAKLTPAMDALGVWIDGINFDTIVNGIREFYLGAVDVKDLLTTGFTENETLLPDGVVSGLIVAHDVFVAIGDAFRGTVSAVQGGDLAGPFNSIQQSLVTLQPAVSEFISQMPNLGLIVTSVAAAALPVLSGALGFLADNIDTIIQFMPLIVAGFVLWRLASVAAAGASIALRTAEVAAIPAQITRNALRLAAARLELQAALATRASTAAEVSANAARNGGMLATARATVALVAQKAAVLASAIATGVVTAAQWAYNAALSANPIGIVILLIAALVAAIIWVATQTTFFQDAWSAVTQVVGAAWQWLWSSVLEPVFGFIGAIFTWIYNTIIVPIVTGIMIYIGLWAALFTWLWDTVLAPVFGFIGAIFAWIYNNIIIPIVTGIMIYIGLWAAVFTWLWDTVISPVVNFIGAILNWLWTSVIQVVVLAIQVAIAAWGAIFQWLYDSVISPVASFIGSAIQAIGMIFSWLWENAVNPAIQAVAGAFNWVWNSIIMPIANFINGAINTIGDTVNAVFSGIADFMGSAFSTALSVIRGPINGIISLVNGAIGAINSISVTIPSWVPIVGGQTFSANIPKIPSLAVGADIRARQGGTLALLGEGGRAETVTDLGNTNRLIRATTALAEGSGGGDSVVFKGDVYTQDPDELATKINQKKKKARMANGKKVKVG